MSEQPTIDWLRLSPAQTRLMLMAWGNDSITCAGRELNTAHRLERRGLLECIRPIDGGLKGEFRLSADAQAYPPVGLKALVVDKAGRLSAIQESNHDE